MTDNEIDDDADEDDFNDTHGKLLGRSFRATPSLDLDSDLLFGAVESNVDLHRTPLLSPLSPLSPPLASPQAAVGEPIRDPGVFTIIIIFFPTIYY